MGWLVDVDITGDSQPVSLDCQPLQFLMCENVINVAFLKKQMANAKFPHIQQFVDISYFGHVLGI